MEEIKKHLHEQIDNLDAALADNNAEEFSKNLQSINVVGQTYFTYLSILAYLKEKQVKDGTDQAN